VKSHSTWFGLGPTHSDTIVALPPETLQRMVDPKIVEIKLPEDETLPTPEKDANGHLVYNFPAKCTVRQPPVSQYRLAAVIGLAVAGICLWGTLMGSMLPLIFKKLGIDPGIASSPFVATFVDVTGIVIYFSIAKMLLWDVLG
jgi:magnesium transporter